MHFKKSYFWTLSKGPHRVGATPSLLFYLKMEAESVSETLLLKKKKHWTMDKVQKQDSSKPFILINLN
jgi:hypothetical protein